MAKKTSKSTKVKKGLGFNIADIMKNIQTKALEKNKDRIEERVAVMVNSLAKREAETEHYRGRVDRMFAAFGSVTNVAQLERWFAEGF